MHLISDLQQNTAPGSVTHLAQLGGGLNLSRLTSGYEREVLGFLDRRPSHTFGLAGFIRDNSLVSPRNRGKFYSCRDREGSLIGVALIGHAVLFETTTDDAIEVFARLAGSHSGAFMTLSEQEKSNIFCRHYSRAGSEPDLICREILFEKRFPGDPLQSVETLRRATLDDVELVVSAHAELASEARGINPLETDAAGFRERCTHRIERGRTWVWTDQQRLMFKADVCSATPEVHYLEGVWVNHAERSKGYGLRCLSQLTRTLLQQTRSICLLADENNEPAQRFYERAGYRQIGTYETLYF